VPVNPVRYVRVDPVDPDKFDVHDPDREGRIFMAYHPDGYWYELGRASPGDLSYELRWDGPNASWQAPELR
jgi:hypothetical protein